MNSKQKKSLPLGIILIFCLIASAQQTVWDNIFSQTQAAHPINLTESFNIDFQLPSEYDLKANFDFNSELKALTLKLSKNIIFQQVNVLKAQIDLQELVLNVDQFLLGCEKFMLGFDDQVNDKIKQKVSNVGISKRTLYMVNLLFKYIGRYQIKSHQQKSEKNSKKTQPSSIFDLLKDNQIFNQLEQALEVDSKDKKDLSLKDIQFYDMFQFAVTDFLPKNPKEIMRKIQQGKQKAQLQNEIDEDILDVFDLQAFDLQILKFVILTNPKTGQIVKVYKNKQLEEQIQFSLQSKEKTKSQCNKQAKKLTLEDLMNGAKYLYENKDTMGNVLN